MCGARARRALLVPRIALCSPAYLHHHNATSTPIHHWVPGDIRSRQYSLRNAITSLDNISSAVSSSTAFRLLLVSELASHSVGVNLPLNYNSNTNVEWIITLLESIGSVAGNVAIDDVDSSVSEYPVPMMAALNAALGMVASACCASILRIGKSVNAPPLLPMDKDAVHKAVLDTMKRCQ